MRSGRVICLLISLLQFIFFLKLIEYVRGEEITRSGNLSHLRKQELRKDGDLFAQTETREETPRGLFLAPKMKRKRLEQQKKAGELAKSKTAGSSATNSTIKKAANSDLTQRLNLTAAKDRKEEVALQQQGRACPACENDICPINDPISAGIPIWPIAIAIAIGVGWFALFLLFFLFFIKKDKHEPPAGGYGGYGDGYSDGYGSSGTGYGSPQPVYGPVQDSEEEEPSILDHFLKPHERSYQRSIQFLNFVLDSISKLTDKYNNS